MVFNKLVFNKLVFENQQHIKYSLLVFRIVCDLSDSFLFFHVQVNIEIQAFVLCWGGKNGVEDSKKIENTFLIYKIRQNFNFFCKKITDPQRKYTHRTESPGENVQLLTKPMNLNDKHTLAPKVLGQFSRM